MGSSLNNRAEQIPLIGRAIMTVAVFPLAARPQTFTGRRWDVVLVAASGTILLVTFYCLYAGITTVFMHLYYFPIIFLAYRHHGKGVAYAAVLSLLYLVMVVYFQYSQAMELISAVLRVMSFMGVAAVTAWLSIQLANEHRQLCVTNQFNESIISNANVWLTLMDSTGKILVWNEAAGDISGYGADEVVGKNTVWKLLYPDPDYRKKITSTIATIINEEKIFENFETTIRAKKGEEKIISWNTRGIADEHEIPTRFVAIGIDITARKHAEEALVISELRFRRTFETAKDGLLLLDRESWEILKVNKALTEILGYSADEITGKKFEETGLLKNAGDFQIARQKLAEYGFIFFEDVPVETKKGQRLDTEIYLIDRTLQVQVNVRDITARKRAEKELILRNEELRAAYVQVSAAEEELRHNYSELSQIQKDLAQARRKLNLLNSVTFEDIREAVFSLTAYVELQRQLVKDTSVTGYIEKEQAIIQRIEDSLNFTKNYQHMGINPPQWQNVNQTFLFAISHLGPLTVNRKIALDNLEIYADPLLEKVLFNIMENVTLHRAGATEFAFYYEEIPSGLLLIMEDNGTGIPEEEKEIIFSRGPGSRKRMGLFLAREILEITGITMKETGIPGKGARFEILVPKDKYRFSGSA